MGGSGDALNSFERYKSKLTEASPKVFFVEVAIKMLLCYLFEVKVGVNRKHSKKGVGRCFWVFF